MIKNILLITLVSAALLSTSTSANAQVIFDINEVMVAAGDTVNVDVFASGDQTVIGFNLPVDIGLDGTGVPAGLTLNPGFNSLLPAPSSSVGGPIGAADFVANSSDLFGPGASLTATPVSAFTVSFTVDSGVADGTVFNLGLLDGTGFDVVGAGGTSIANSVQLSGGTITVSNAVPEPSGLALVLVGVGGLMIRRRRN